MTNREETGEYEEDFTPKTANRKISKTMIIVAAIVVLSAGAGIAGYLIYQGTHYYKTDNAKVDAAVYQLATGAEGRLARMDVTQGEEVIAGQVLARVANGPIVRSPIDGTVIDVKMQVGDYPTASDVVVIIAKTSDMYITANVEETSILKIHTGQTVSVSLDAYGRTFTGYVEEVDSITSTRLAGSATSFTTSGTYAKVTQLVPIRIKLTDSVDLASIIGTNATVKIRIK
jgi:multidrug resistance efflux pump